MIKRDLPALRTLIENKLALDEGSGTTKSMSGTIEQAQQLLDQALTVAMKNPRAAFKLASKATKIAAQLPYEGVNKAVHEAAFNLSRALSAYVDYHTYLAQ